MIIPEPLEQLIQEYKLREYPPHYYIFGEKKQPAAKRAGRDYLYKRHCKILKSLNMDGQEYNTYSYKHTAVINLFNAGVDIKDIQKQCRHASIQQTDKYLKDLGLFRNDDLEKKYPIF